MLSLENIPIGVSDAVGLINQTLDNVYPQMTVVGELINLRLAKGKWVYFDIRDEYSKLHCFGTTYVLPGPLEDGMMVEVVVVPRLHPQFGFSANLSSVRPVGEGSLLKAASLLQKKLEAEGLFALERKRTITKIPTKIALITSDESAAYSDFMKIVKARWPLLRIDVYSVLVQGIAAVNEIIQAIERANLSPDTVEVLVITRGGGSADDLAAFSDERLVRAVAASRIPTVIAIGHERDVSLAELASDLHASTPSNAAELLTPDKNMYIKQLNSELSQLRQSLNSLIESQRSGLINTRNSLLGLTKKLISDSKNRLSMNEKTVNLLDPLSVLKRGYAMARKSGHAIKTVEMAKKAKDFDLSFVDGEVSVTIK